MPNIFIDLPDSPIPQKNGHFKPQTFVPHQNRRRDKHHYQTILPFPCRYYPRKYQGFSMTPKQFKARHRVTNPEMIDDLYNNHQSVIMVSGHYGNGMGVSIGRTSIETQHGRVLQTGLKINLSTNTCGRSALPLQ
jgi:hypothetical protein